MENYSDFRKKLLNEVSSTSARYSVEVNYRTNVSETLEAFAKICLGYVSAAMKNFGYHVKHVYDDKPIRIIVAVRNWDDGEWVACLSWNSKLNGFVISKGFWRKDTKSVSSITNVRAKGDDAAELSKELRNILNDLKGRKDRHQEKLKPVPLKRGPK